MASAGGRAMEKPIGQDQNQPLKCPRCDSSNTKFCYYNNYSLSQPRHFCKACKRYWTRGGTLRNVPVGGGCRKNKRLKRPASALESPSSSAPSVPSTNPSHVQTQMEMPMSSSSNHVNPLFYGLPANASELTLPFPRFNSRVSTVDTVSGFDLQPQLNGLGLGFPSGLMGSDVTNPSKQIQEVVSSTSLLSSFSTSPTMASLLASSLHQQHKFMSSTGLKDIREPPSFQGLLAYEDLQMGGSGEALKEVKMEEAQTRLDWTVPSQNQMEQISPSDPSLYWNSPSVGAWLDPTNVGSSVHL